MCIDIIMPTKCFTKANKKGEPYTACVDTKTFKKKNVKGNAKSRKPTAKGIMVVRKKRKIKKRFKTKRLTEMAKKSTIKPPLTKSKPKPKPKPPKKLSAGQAVLFTQRGFMTGVGAYVGTRRDIYYRRMRDDRARLEAKRKAFFTELDRKYEENKAIRATKRGAYFDEKNRNIKDGQKLLADLKKSKSARTPKERQRVNEWLQDRKKVNKLYNSLRKNRLLNLKDSKGAKMRTLLGKALQKRVAYT